MSRMTDDMTDDNLTYVCEHTSWSFKLKSSLRTLSRTTLSCFLSVHNLITPLLSRLLYANEQYYNLAI